MSSSLPRLPLPDVDKTLDRYLDAIEAIVTEDEFEATKAKVEAFKSDSTLIEGINEHLKERGENEDNWV